MGKTRWTRRLTVLLVVACSVLLVPVSAYASILAKATASQGYTVLTWKAVAVAPAASAGTGSYSLAMNVTDKKSRSGIFEIVNAGTSALSGVTMTVSTSGIASGSSVTYTRCTVAWAVASNGKSHTCSGSTSSLGSISSGTGSRTVTLSIPVGARLYVRATTTAPEDNTATSQTISIKVTRSQAVAKRNR